MKLDREAENGPRVLRDMVGHQKFISIPRSQLCGLKGVGIGLGSEIRLVFIDNLEFLYSQIHFS